MLVYERAYLEVKNKYVLPLTKVTVQYRDLKKTYIKAILTTKFTSVEDNNKSYMFSFDEDELWKGLTGDILLFYMRYLLQKRDSNKVDGIRLSPNWNIVTHYYEAFFAASLLLRLTHRGSIFLDELKRRELESVMSSSMGYLISLDSNLFYEIISEDESAKLKLQKGDANTHETVWKKMDSLLDELLLLARPKSDEITLLKSIKQINNKLQNTYPSKIRNKVNYQPLYGLEAIERKLFPINSNVSWVDFLLKYESISWDNENSVVNALYCYTQYIEKFCENLITEYYQIKGNQNGVIKRYNEYTGEHKAFTETIFSIP